jgi:hypothetical protein
MVEANTYVSGLVFSVINQTILIEWSDPDGDVYDGDFIAGRYLDKFTHFDISGLEHWVTGGKERENTHTRKERNTKATGWPIVWYCALNTCCFSHKGLELSDSCPRLIEHCLVAPFCSFSSPEPT